MTQDEDYLNVLCKNRIQYIEHIWNIAPIPGTIIPDSQVKLVHYKMAWKPWKYDNVGYEKLFWDYAVKTSYYDELLELKKRNNTPESKEIDEKELKVLMDRAILDMNDPDNYCNKEVLNAVESSIEIETFSVDDMRV